MKHFRTLLLLLLSVVPAAISQAQPADNPDRQTPRSPLFVENSGQWHSDARYLSRLPGLDLWIGNSGLVYDFHRLEPATSASPRQRVGHVVGMHFIGANAASHAVATKSVDSRFSYGVSSASHSASLVTAGAYREGWIRDIYKGIDLLLHIEEGSPRYDFIVAPGADPRTIRIAWDGAANVRVDHQGSLAMTTSMGEITHNGLYAYQTVNGTRRQVECSFTVDPDNGEVGFRVGSYDRSRPLVIDPLVYATYLGGAADDFGHALAVDATGNAYVTGSTFSINYPTTNGAYRETMTGNEWVFVTKLNPTATGLPVYSTFIGPGVGNAIKLDATGNAYITGIGYSGYPTTPGALATSNTGADVFVTKVSPSGAALVYSAIVGPGTGNALALDNNIVYVTGSTSSRSFPTSVGALQTTVNGTGPDAFVAKVSSNGSSLLYSTLLGGTGTNSGNAIAVNPAGEAFVAGSTNATDFPTTATAVQTTKGSGATADAFVVRLGADADTLVYGSYLGGDGEDNAYAVAINDSNRAFVAGWTLSSDFPTSANAYRLAPYDSNDAFVAQIGAAGDTLIYSTYLGSAGVDIAREVAVDASNSAYVAGTTGSGNFPTTISRYQGSLAGGIDGFLTRFTPDGRKLLYSTFFGGDGNDSLDGMALDPAGDIYLAGSTTSSNLPTTPGVTQRTKLLASDLFVVKLNLLRILKPNGGEIICANTIDTIRWTGGTNTTYDIYISNNQGASFNLLASNVLGNSYLWPVGGVRPDTTYRIRVATSNGAESDTSDANFTINAPALITAEPIAATGSSGGSATFTSIGTGTPAPTKQWQVNNGTVWQDIPSATSANLTLNSLNGSQNGYLYRVIYSNGCGSDTSQSVVLTVSQLRMLTPNGGENLCSGTSFQITWGAIGTSGPYRLDLSSDAGVTWTTIESSVLDSTYTWNIAKALAGDRYRVRIVLPPGQTFDMSDANFTINSTPVVTKEPVDYTVIAGGALVYSAEATSFPDATIQWEENDGTGWKPIPNETAKSVVLYDATVAKTGYLYRAIFTTVCGSDTTRAATATVTPNSTGGVETGNEATNELRLVVAPNPARRTAEIRFTLPKAGTVELTITDILGRPVASPIIDSRSAGDGSIPLDLAGVPNGTYIVTLRSSNRTSTVQVTVAK